MKFIYITLLSLLLFTCKDQKAEVNLDPAQSGSLLYTSVSKKQFDAQNMQIDTLKTRQFIEGVDVTGFIDVPPQNKAKVNTFFEGYVVKIIHLVGDVVKKGQLIATLEHPDYVDIQQNFIEVSEQLNYLNAEYKRQQELFNENITSEKNYLKAKSTYKSNLARYNGLKKTIEMMNLNPDKVEKGIITSKINLYAPISGSITKVNVNKGEFVSSSTEIVEIINTDHIHLELVLFEKDILKIKKGQEIRFKIPESSSKRYKAEVHLVGNAIDAQDRTIQVHAHIDDPEVSQLIAGMFVEAQIITSNFSARALPKKAVIKEDSNYYALSLKEQTPEAYIFERIKIIPEFENEEYIAIKSSKNFEGQKFLIDGVFMLSTESE
jgi:cobalt-zinc-cadmium efflux system membrane fusion protein